MCIRDSPGPQFRLVAPLLRDVADEEHEPPAIGQVEPAGRCLLYTSDAADERSSVDLGGRRIIKKKKK